MSIVTGKLGWCEKLRDARPRWTSDSCRGSPSASCSHLVVNPQCSQPEPQSASTTRLWQNTPSPTAAGKTLKSSKETTKQAKRAFQAGNSALDPRPKRLPMRQHLVHEVLHPPRDRQGVHQLRQLLELASSGQNPLSAASTSGRCRRASGDARSPARSSRGRLLPLIDFVVGDELLRRLAQAAACGRTPPASAACPA